MPTVTINLDMVDLSKSLEYFKKGYSWLEDIQLGDKVRCEDREHDIYTYERVVGITYDCIRKMNTQITIGVPDSTVAEKLGVANGSPQPTGGYDMSIIEGEIDNIQDDIASLQTNKQNKLIAGQNITITSGNVISATGGVVPNPVGTATETLNTILINGVIYRVGGSVTTAVNTRLMLPSGNRSVSEEGSVIL
jgi:phage-related protein